MHYIVSIPYDIDIAQDIGKKGSENSITFFNRKEKENVIVCLVPSNPEEKFYSVAESVMLADQVVLSTREIDSRFGEVIIAAQLLNKKLIFTNESDVSTFSKELNFVVSERGRIIEKIINYKNQENAKPEGETLVLIDKVFPVKGIGTVALGFVKNGKVQVHDTLYHNSGKKVLVRSIQLQDVSVPEAGVGTRVGLALKNVEASEIKKGDVLSTTLIPNVNEVSAELESIKIHEEEIKIGKVYGLVSNFIFVKAEVINFDNATRIVKLRLARAVPLKHSSTFVLIRDIIPRIFAKGSIK